MKRLKILYHSFYEIWCILRPTSHDERIVFLTLLFYFSAIAIMFCIVALPKDIPLGLLGYDTAGHLEYEPMMICSNNMLDWNLRHPLYRLFLFPIIIINEGLLLIGINISWPLFIASSTWMLSCSGLYIFKILRSLQLSIKESSLLLSLFCSFAHVIMLSIQVDSFVMSMFFCTCMTLLFVNQFHNKLSDSILFLGIAGTTSTNFFKFLFYQLLEEKNIKKTITRFMKSIPTFCLLFAFTTPNLVIRLIECPRGFLYAVVGDSFYYRGSDASKWRLFFENFLSEPLIFHHTTGIIYSQETIYLPNYAYLWYYLPISIIFLLVILSVILNWHQKVIQLFCYCFGFDLFMHFGIGYGMEEGQLFCGHWLFFIPIVLGFLFTNQLFSKKTPSIVLAICAAIMLIANLFHFYQSL